MSGAGCPTCPWCCNASDEAKRAATKKQHMEHFIWHKWDELLKRLAK